MIPKELTERNQWVCWRLEIRDGNKTKVPYQPNGRKAEADDPATWSTHEECEAARSRFSGIGYVFAEGDPYFGVDLDDCFEGGKLKPYAEAIVDRFNTYTEISPSGNGVKLWGRGKKKGARSARRGAPFKIEMYDEERYFTVTANVLLDRPIRECQAEFDALYDDTFPVVAPRKQSAGGDGADESRIVELASNAVNSAKFLSLWRGEFNGYGSRSEADLALCSIVAFYAGPEPDKIERVVRQSGLAREKWERPDYLHRTITKCLEGRSEFYSASGGPITIPATLDLLGGPPASIEAPAKADAPKRVRPSIPANRGRLSNVEDGERTIKGKTVPVSVYKTIDAIGVELLDIGSQWPKIAGGILFVEQQGQNGPEPRWLTGQDEFFAWVHETCGVRWKGTAEKNPTLCAVTQKVMHPPTKGEFFSHVQLSTLCERYLSIARLPHEPKIPGIYYLDVHLPEPTGAHLEEFIAAFNPETELDRSLLKSLLLTMGWGGAPGTRPLFVISSSHGMGAGKTATARAIGDVWGGIVELDADLEWPEQCKRIMSSEDRDSRAFLFDNIQGRFGGRGIEAAITAKRISGWRSYVGSVSRPNDATYIATINGPELSADLSQRAVIIHIGKPKHGTDFYGWARDYIGKHGLNIVADCLAALREPAKPLTGLVVADRFQAWTWDIIGRVPSPGAVAGLIQERRPAADADAEDREAWASMVAGLCDGSEHAQTTAVDIYKAAVAAKLWQPSKDKSESADRQACLRRGERLLAGTGAIEPLKGDTGKVRRLDATASQRSRVYTVRVTGEDADQTPI